MDKQPTEAQYALYERIAIKMYEGGLSEEEAMRQAEAEAAAMEARR